MKFSEPVKLEHLQLLFPNASSFAAKNGQASFWDVFDQDSHKIGSALRTAPSADNVVGYQGPTDVLIGFDSELKAGRFSILFSYDNQPYVRYVEEDESFSTILLGENIQGISGLDIEESRFEGVSGATMTSSAVIESIKVAANDFLRKLNSKPKLNGYSALPIRDLGTIVVLLVAALLAFTKWRGHRWLRVVFQVVLIGYLGLVNGDLLSQALIAGWAQTRIPWSSALGLVTLSFAALLVPVFSKRNFYCSHVCPHGALQDLARNRLPYRVNFLPASKSGRD